MALVLKGKKRGMTQRFDQKGRSVACTVIEVGASTIVQLKSEERDGYQALQLAYEEISVKDERTIEKRVSKSLRGHYAKAGVKPSRVLEECRVDAIDGFEVGQALTLADLGELKYVDVMGRSKGKGFQGVMKRHNFAGGPAAHGSGFHRRAGSTGMRSTPGRCLPGVKKAGRMGGARVTQEGLRVIVLDAERGLLLVEGSVPGPIGGFVTIRPAQKRANKS